MLMKIKYKTLTFWSKGAFFPPLVHGFSPEKCPYFQNPSGGVGTVKIGLLSTLHLITRITYFYVIFIHFKIGHPIFGHLERLL